MEVEFPENATVGDLLPVLLKLPSKTKLVLAEGPPVVNCEPGRFQNRCSPIRSLIVGKYEMQHQNMNFSIAVDPDDQPADSVCLFPCD